MSGVPTVFIVDDDEAMRDALLLLGKAIGLQVEAYPSAQAFLESYNPPRPGCLVLDLCMPGMSGLELQEYLVASRIDLPVILVTGNPNSPEVERALKTGVVDVIEKPFNVQVLINQIRTVLLDEPQ